MDRNHDRPNKCHSRQDGYTSTLSCHPNSWLLGFFSRPIPRAPISFVVGNSNHCHSSTLASAVRQRQIAVGRFSSAPHMSHLSVTRRFGLLPEIHNRHSQPWPAFKSYRLTTRSRRSFRLGARAQKPPAMLLPPRRRVRTGAICSTDGAIGFVNGWLRLPAACADDSKGRRCGAPWIDTAVAQS